MIAAHSVAAPSITDDLRWLLTSPPLVNPAHPRFCGRVVTFAPREQSLIEHWLDQVAAKPATLHAFIAPFLAQRGPVRLGRYAERLLEFYLREGPLHRLVAANLPIRRDADSRVRTDHTTIGEIDFLVETVAGEREHWEMAVKYFLHMGTSSPQRTDDASSDDYIGPDRAEVLTAKLDKLFERQLGNCPPPPFDQHVWRPRAFTRGWMFYSGPVPRCALLHTDHMRGGWRYRATAHALADGRYIHVPRQDWLARRVVDASDPRVLSRAALLNWIDALWAAPAPGGARRWPSAQLIARLDQTDHDETRLSEVERLFIVPDDAPHLIAHDQSHLAAPRPPHSSL